MPQRVIAQSQVRAVSARALSTASRSYVARVGGPCPPRIHPSQFTGCDRVYLAASLKTSLRPAAAMPGAGAGALRSMGLQTPAVLASSGARFASTFKTAYDAKVRLASSPCRGICRPPLAPSLSLSLSCLHDRRLRCRLAAPFPHLITLSWDIHPGGNPGANVKSISHRCHLFEVAFVWELTT